jgi:hypothetical protein
MNVSESTTGESDQVNPPVTVTAITSDVLAVLQAAAAIQVLEMEGQLQSSSSDAGQDGGDDERKPAAG